MKKIITVLVLTLLPFILMAADAKLSQEKLDQVMAPIALYPDPLLSEMLMASTYPEQVQEAAEWSKNNPDQKGDDAVQAVANNTWDPSVASLVAFPQVLDMMGEKPDWVKEMGDAFLAEPGRVMDTVQRLRMKARDAGNLKSSNEQQVIVEKSDGVTTIIIEPASPQTIYVPVYNPMYVYGAWMYPAYPPYYYYPPYFVPAPGFYYGFTFGIFVGNTMWGSFNWHHHDIYINVRKYNTINFHRRININAANASWRNDLRHNNRPPIIYVNKPYQRDLQRINARKAMEHKGINLKHERQNLDKRSVSKVKDHEREERDNRAREIRNRDSHKHDRSSKGDERGYKSDRESDGDAMHMRRDR